MLRRGGFSDEASRGRALLRIEDEATRMGGLVEDLLLLAELDRGRPLRAEPVDLGLLCADVVADTDALDHDHLLSLELGAAPVIVLGDPERLAQVAHNLVRNAVAHTPAGTTVTVSVGVEGTAGDAMGLLRVSDTGSGIDPLQAARIFDRFYRGDPARPAPVRAWAWPSCEPSPRPWTVRPGSSPHPPVGHHSWSRCRSARRRRPPRPTTPTPPTTPAQRVRLPQAH